MRNKDFSFLLKVGLALCLGMILRFSAFAQCENGYSTHTFDTALTSNGFGMYTLTVPQWHPDSGTLLSVKVSTAVTSQYGFTLRNADNQSATYNLTIGQEDIISGAALSSPITSITNQYTNNYPLSPGQSITDGPFPLMNNHITSDSITDNIVPFLGAGNVTLSYMSFTYTGLNAVNSATYYYSSNINNNMHFTVQYVYCTAGSVVLAANLTRFSAQLSNPRTTDLAWSAVNETADRVYDIQRSTDSKTFQTVTSINAQGSETSANYDYSDKIPDSVSGDVYYRLQIHDQGKLSWSAVQKVTVAALTTMATAATTTPTGFNIFPNPATSYINITTGQPAEDWQIDILSSNGNLVQRSTVLQSSTLSVPFTKQLPSGTYFARLTGLRSQKTLSATFIVVNGD